MDISDFIVAVLIAVVVVCAAIVTRFSLMLTRDKTWFGWGVCVLSSLLLLPTAFMILDGGGITLPAQIEYGRSFALQLAGSILALVSCFEFMRTVVRPTDSGVVTVPVAAAGILAGMALGDGGWIIPAVFGAVVVALVVERMVRGTGSTSAPPPAAPSDA